MWKEKIKFGLIDIPTTFNGYINETQTYSVRIMSSTDNHYTIKCGRMLKGNLSRIDTPETVNKNLVYDIYEKELNLFQQIWISDFIGGDF
jgi:hypothetical protein